MPPKVIADGNPGQQDQKRRAQVDIDTRYPADPPSAFHAHLSLPKFTDHCDGHTFRSAAKHAIATHSPTQQGNPWFPCLNPQDMGLHHSLKPRSMTNLVAVANWLRQELCLSFF